MSDLGSKCGCQVTPDELVELDYSTLHWCPRCGSRWWTGRNAWMPVQPEMAQHYERLEAENAKLRAESEIDSHELTQLHYAIFRLENERGTLLAENAKLRRYVRHSHGCDLVREDGFGRVGDACDCGLGELLKESE